MPRPRISFLSIWTHRTWLSTKGTNHHPYCQVVTHKIIESLQKNNRRYLMKNPKKSASICRGSVQKVWNRKIGEPNEIFRKNFFLIQKCIYLSLLIQSFAFLVEKTIIVLTKLVLFYLSIIYFWILKLYLLILWIIKNCCSELKFHLSKIYLLCIYLSY